MFLYTKNFLLELLHGFSLFTGAYCLCQVADVINLAHIYGVYTIPCHGHCILYKHRELSPQALIYHIHKADQEYCGVQVTESNLQISGR